MDDFAIGQRIKQRRKDLNLIHEEVIDRLSRDSAIRTGRGTFSISHLSRMERGKSGDLKVDDLRAVARALETNLSWLLGGDSPDLAEAVAVFGPSEKLTKDFADIANFYRGATESERYAIELAISDMAEQCRTRDNHAPRLSFGSHEGESTTKNGDLVGHTT